MPTVAFEKKHYVTSGEETAGIANVDVALPRGDINILLITIHSTEPWHKLGAQLFTGPGAYIALGESVTTDQHAFYRYPNIRGKFSKLRGNVLRPVAAERITVSVIVEI